jgi:hypothetical protein
MTKANQRFSFWTSDWIGGTSSLTPAERGVYIDLLAEQWQRGPLDESQALAAGRADAELVRQVLAKKFHRNPDGRWQNNRLEQERGKSRPRPAPRPTDAGTVSAAAPLLVFPCRGEPATWGLDAAQVQAWKDLYQGVDVLAECHKALAWVQANGGKTAKGMARFLVNWLNRVTDSTKGSRASDAAKTRAGRP